MDIQPNKTLPNDNKISDEKIDPKKVFLERIQHWMKQFDDNVDNLYDFIKQNINYGKNAPSHGDFTPWHILSTNENRLFLIDGEHSKIDGFKFYDLAYFYHRTYTGLKRPDIADRFLEEFNKQYSFDETDKQCFRLILAQRVIGGYLDAKNDNDLDAVTLNDKLSTTILEDKLSVD